MNKTITTIKINKKYTSEEKRAIAQEFIDHIRARSKKGQGKNMKPWSGRAGKYSDRYKESLPFKIAGKTNKVNQRLSGDMLASIVEFKRTKPGEIKIGLKKSDADYGKAEGNILGTYGKSTPIPGKKRPFLDIGQKDKDTVLKRFPIKDAEKRKSEIEKVLEAMAVAKKIVDKS